MHIRPKSAQELLANRNDLDVFQAQLFDRGHDIDWFVREPALATNAAGEISKEALASYVTAQRDVRRMREDYFQKPINAFLDARPLPERAEQRQIEQLRKRVIDVAHPEESPVDMEKAFPSGVYLFHGATTSALTEILSSGNLVNAHALGERGYRASNGGQEGISWSFAGQGGGIEAIPATRYHMAGLVAAPEKILGDMQLVVPDMPAPYEVVQISSKIDAASFYGEYAQARSLEDVLYGIHEMQNANSEDRAELDGEVPAAFYERDDEGNFQLTRLFNEYIDSTDTPSLEAAKIWLKLNGIDTDDESLDEEFGRLIDRIRQMKQHIKDQLSHKTDVRIPVEKLFFVTPAKDLEQWLRVLARCPAKPAGIMVYDSTNVRLEDFATEHRGDAGELASQIQHAIGDRTGDVTYEAIIGKPFDDSMRESHARHIMAAINHNDSRRVVMRDGKLALTP